MRAGLILGGGGEGGGREVEVHLQITPNLHHNARMP